MITSDRNKVNVILENLNEARTIDLGSGSSAYQYGGKYYIKKGNEKKEISADQYSKLLSKNKNGSNKKAKSSSNSKISSDSYKTNKRTISWVNNDAWTYDDMMEEELEGAFYPGDPEAESERKEYRKELEEEGNKYAKILGCSRSDLMTYNEEFEYDSPYYGDDGQHLLSGLTEVETIEDGGAHGITTKLYKDKDGTGFITRSGYGETMQIYFRNPKR